MVLLARVWGPYVLKVHKDNKTEMNQLKMGLDYVARQNIWYNKQEDKMDLPNMIYNNIPTRQLHSNITFAT